MSDAAAMRAEGLRKTFPGGVRAVRDLDLHVPAGTAFGLIGRNGAGKTTTLRVLLGLLRQDSGRATILGRSMWGAPAAHRERVTYVSQDLNLHPWMSVRELCEMTSCFYSRWDPAYAGALARRFELPLETPAALLSGGERRKAAILLALAPGADLIVLDEPVAGLDPVARRELLDALVEVLSEGRGRTILFSTHIISDLERIADHVGILDHGRLLIASPLDELKSRMRRVQFVFAGKGPPPGFRLPGALRTEVEGPVVSALLRDADEELLEALAVRHGARVQLFPLGLEDLFIELAGAEGSGAPPEAPEGRDR